MKTAPIAQAKKISPQGERQGRPEDRFSGIAHHAGWGPHPDARVGRTFGFGDRIAQHLSDSQRGENTQLRLADLFRQPVYIRIAGDEENFGSLARIHRELIGKAEALDSPQRIVPAA